MKKVFWVFFLLTSRLCAQNDLQGGRDQTRILIGDQTASLFANERVDTAYNRAIRECGLLAGVLIMAEDTLTTSLNVDRYALNADFWRLRSVWSGLTAQRTPIVIVDEPYTAGGLGLQNMPSQYCFISQNSLFLYGLPTGTTKILVFYYRFPRKLSAAADTTDIPYMLRPALPLLAASYLSFMTKQLDQAAVFYNRATELIAAYRQFFRNTGKPEEAKNP